MKRILLSLGMIVFVGAAAWGATGAFFTDAETSTGNTFTAGTLDLQVDSTSHYDGLICSEITAGIFHWIQDPNASTTVRADLINQPCDGTWSQRDLGPANKFFNISDIKPGDNGEDTISLHTTNNAWICANITTTSNSDNTVIAPEVAAGDNASSTAGELAQNTFVFGWIDNASTSGAVPGDNKWQAGETVLFQPTALSAIASGTPLVLPLADSTHGSAFIASTTNYVGVAWCTGTMNVSVPGTVGCSGANLGNIIQTDSATADITLTATQSRNNPTFTCGGATTTATTTVTLDKIVTFTNQQIVGVDVSDYALHVFGPGGDHILTDEVPFVGLTPGVYTVSEVYSGNPANATSTAVFGGSCTEIGTTDTATMTVVPGVNPTCTITNSVSVIPS